MGTDSVINIAKEAQDYAQTDLGQLLQLIKLFLQTEKL